MKTKERYFPPSSTNVAGTLYLTMLADISDPPSLFPRCMSSCPRTEGEKVPGHQTLNSSTSIFGFELTH